MKTKKKAVKPPEEDFFLRMDSQGHFKLDVPKKLNMGRLIVDYWAEHGRAEDVAIYDQDRKITYGELKDLTNRIGYGLYKLGLRKEDRFVIRTPNMPEYMMAFVGGQKIGAVPIPTNIMLREGEVEHIVSHSEAKAIITTTKHLEAVDNILPNCKTLKNVIVIGGAKGKHVPFEDLLKEDGSKIPYVETLKDDPA